MNAACQLCEENIASDIWNISTDNFTDDSIYTTIKEMAPKYDDVQILCNTFGEWTDCTDVLFPIYTEEGLCYVFNSKNVNDIVKCQWVYSSRTGARSEILVGIHSTIEMFMGGSLFKKFLSGVNSDFCQNSLLIRTSLAL